jgi:HSP20 family protein
MARNSLTPFGGGLLTGGTDPLFTLHRQMNQLFDDIWRSPGSRAAGEGALPSVTANMNVAETDQALRVTVELPGVSEQDIDVSLHDDLLTIRGEKKFEQEKGGDKENYHFMERSYGTFQRSLRLPFTADPQQVQASFQNGVLTVTVPKSAQQQTSHRIQVQTGSASQTSALPPQTQETTQPSQSFAPSAEKQTGDNQSAPPH